MPIALTVTRAFADYQPGDQITDPALIAAVKATDNAANVVQVSLPDEPTPAPQAAPQA